MRSGSWWRVLKWADPAWHLSVKFPLAVCCNNIFRSRLPTAASVWWVLYLLCHNSNSVRPPISMSRCQAGPTEEIRLFWTKDGNFSAQTRLQQAHSNAAKKYLRPYYIYILNKKNWILLFLDSWAPLCYPLNKKINWVSKSQFSKMLTLSYPVEFTILFYVSVYLLTTFESFSLQQCLSLEVCPTW